MAPSSRKHIKFTYRASALEQEEEIKVFFSLLANRLVFALPLELGNTLEARWEKNGVISGNICTLVVAITCD